ncbi:MAG: N-acetyltransferase [Bacteroidota bacterium]|nr:N-acetyltransferase [Bacteroidota bacterium]
MNLIIRQETKNDYLQVFNLIEQAFCNEPFSDHREQYLVEKLRKSDTFVPELSIVAEIEKEIAGYLLLSRITIKNKTGLHPSLALAPVAVKPGFQKQGIGTKLIKEGHKKAAFLGYKSVILLGHNEYYPRFGYKNASFFGISLPFDVPDENAMAIELVKNGLKGVSGEVIYPKEFFE